MGVILPTLLQSSPRHVEVGCEFKVDIRTKILKLSVYVGCYSISPNGNYMRWDCILNKLRRWDKRWKIIT